MRLTRQDGQASAESLCPLPADVSAGAMQRVGRYSLATRQAG